jgi:hypothetical protein
MDVIDVNVIGDTRLHIKFDDGREGDLECTGFLSFNGVFEPLRDPREFAKVRVDPESGTICWPNGADIDPYVLYSRVTGAPLPELGQ